MTRHGGSGTGLCRPRLQPSGVFFFVCVRDDKTSIYFSANIVRAAMASGGLSDLLLIPGFSGLPPGTRAALKSLGLIPETSGLAGPHYVPIVQVGGKEIVEGRLLCAARVRKSRRRISVFSWFKRR